ncbi:MAG: UbiH/UbiF/VisC/COQ6 family ubiquinone biosynthesis hydroxylase [Salinisphaeraceae bacterium]
MADVFDIAVVGGGMVGAVLAVALERAGFRVALIEAREPVPLTAADEYDLRVSAVSPASRRLLENLDLWPDLDHDRVAVYHGMRVWEGGGRAQLEFEHTALGLPELGHIIENRLIVDAAWRALRDVTRFCPAELKDLSVAVDAATLTLADGRELQARLVVGAEGAGSPVRQFAGIDTVGWPYRQRCTVGTVATERSHQSIAWQRYTPTGPVAFLPMADGRCSLAWHADDRLADELRELDDVTFAERLTEASGGVLGRVTRIDSRAAFPLRLMHATDYVRPRIVLAGDAAHVLHPMAGQGANLGFMDVATLVEVLEQARAAGRDPGDDRRLRRYQRRRKVDNLAMMAVTDGIKRMFGVEDPALSRLRDRGIAAVQDLAPLKQLMMRQAVGLGGDLPPLLR